MRSKGPSSRILRGSMLLTALAFDDVTARPGRKGHCPGSPCVLSGTSARTAIAQHWQTTFCDISSDPRRHVTNAEVLPPSRQAPSRLARGRRPGTLEKTSSCPLAKSASDDGSTPRLVVVRWAPTTLL
jgi:hypothetical protein